MNKTIGLIGLGNMGYGIGKNLLKLDNNLNIFDKSDKNVQQLAGLGARSCKSAEEVISNSDIIFLSLPTSKIVESILLNNDNIELSLLKGKTFVDMSSSNPESTRFISKTFEEYDINYLDAPVSGGPDGAIDGTLSIMVGGSEEKYDECLPIFNKLGKNVNYIGEAGTGHSIKAVNNLLYGSIFVATCEAIALGVKSGIKLEKMLEVISKSAGSNFALNNKFPKNVINRDFQPGFSTNLLKKDMDIALEMGKTEEVPLVISQVANQFILLAQQEGYGDDDHTAFIKYYEDIIKKQFTE